MDVRQTTRLLAPIICFVVFVSLCHAQLEHSRYDPAPKHGQPDRKDGFIDFTLKRINSANTNYGDCLDEGGQLLLHETVNNSYFWSNIVALGALTCLFLVTVWQNRIRVKREWAVSEILAQYERALARSNMEIEEAAKKNRTLTESLIALQQIASSSQIHARDDTDKAPPPVMRSRTVKGESQSTVTSTIRDTRASSRSTAAAVPVSAVSQIALFKPEVELVTKVNTLEQQLGRSHEVERQLRRQLDETGKKLQAERTKNQSANVE